MGTVLKTSMATGNARSSVIQWGPMTNGDVGEGIPFAQYADKSVQVDGAFGADGGLEFHGSNDGGANWHPLTDVQGNALRFTTAKIRQVTEVTALCRPVVTGSDPSIQLTVSVCMRESS